MTERGFTLIELLIAAAFLSVAIVAVIETLTGVETLNRDARNSIIAAQLAQQEMDTLRNTPYSNLAAGTYDFSSSLSSYPSLQSPRTATYTIIQADPAGLKQLDIAISYTTRGKTKNVQLTTLVSYIGLNR